MPPKAEMTKEKVLAAAFELVREQGLTALTARSVAQKLGCSTQPIYSVYGNMNDLKDDVYEKAVQFALSSMKAYENDSNVPVLNLAIGSLHFAQAEKQLFKAVYLSGHKKYTSQKDKFIAEEMYTAYFRSRGRLSRISDEKLRKIVKALSVYLIGLGTMINTNTLDLSIEEATAMIQDMYEALLMKEDQQ
ncbi:TetR/AcrR family transcriptional regulator [Paenibacillus sp. JDR-2]|uniref:TetR/AcrR family transcriptional regulator n=1 Tax=Paenibacillus sp. (strain JDR-2) TaxID=324057 RepID=UPI000166A5D9|nr:TetR family transcriptional regulator [Paenibacillus sp. JDR-2]ACT00446.1 putative transcriptional regulator, TetR family [Paenibacillus sp. JDR-2]